MNLTRLLNEWMNKLINEWKKSWDFLMSFYEKKIGLTVIIKMGIFPHLVLPSVKETRMFYWTLSWCQPMCYAVWEAQQQSGYTKSFAPCLCRLPFVYISLLRPNFSLLKITGYNTNFPGEKIKCDNNVKSILAGCPPFCKSSRHPN